jgi:hypothetical protein
VLADQVDTTGRAHERQVAALTEGPGDGVCAAIHPARVLAPV